MNAPNLGTPAKQSEAQRIRDLLVRFVREEELGAHQGRPCLTNRTNMVGYLCHSLGLKPEHLERVAREIRTYDRVCPCPPSTISEWEEHL